MFNNSLLNVLIIFFALTSVYCAPQKTHEQHRKKDASAAPAEKKLHHATESDKSLEELSELVEMVALSFKLPVKGATPFTVSFIDDGGKTIQSNFFNWLTAKKITKTPEAWAAVEKSWKTFQEANKDLKKEIDDEKKAKKGEKPKNQVQHLTKVLAKQAKGHLSEDYSPKQKTLELNWAKQLIELLENKYKTFEYVHPIEKLSLKEVEQDVATLNAMHQRLGKNVKTLKNLLKGINTALSGKEPEKYGKLTHKVPVLDVKGIFHEHASSPDHPNQPGHGGDKGAVRKDKSVEREAAPAEKEIDEVQVTASEPLEDLPAEAAVGVGLDNGMGVDQANQVVDGAEYDDDQEAVSVPGGSNPTP